MSKVQHMTGRKTSCNRSRPVFLFRFFDFSTNIATGNWKISEFVQLQPVVQSFAVGFSLISVFFPVPENWTCKHYNQPSSLTCMRSCLCPTCSDQRLVTGGFFWSALIRIRIPPSPAILAGNQLSNGPTQHYSVLISTDQQAQHWVTESWIELSDAEQNWTELSIASV